MFNARSLRHPPEQATLARMFDLPLGPIHKMVVHVVIRDGAPDGVDKGFLVDRCASFCGLPKPVERLCPAKGSLEHIAHDHPARRASTDSIRFRRVSTFPQRGVTPHWAVGTEPPWAARTEGRCVNYSHP
jgi:hypothetical protein